jgi:hypothetical protein
VTTTNILGTKLGYSIDGHRLELVPGAFGGVSLKVDGEKHPEFKVSLGRPEYPLKLGNREVLIRCHAGRLRSVNVVSRGHELYPNTKHVKPVPAQAGSMCGAHPAIPAVVACLRCGTFACAECAAADGTYCPACFQRISEEGKARSAALAYVAPVIIFVALFGLLGGLLGGVAAAVSYAVARRSSSRMVKLGVSIGAYVVMGLICLAFTVWLAQQRK